MDITKKQSERRMKDPKGTIKKLAGKVRGSRATVARDKADNPIGRARAPLVYMRHDPDKTAPKSPSPFSAG